MRALQELGGTLEARKDLIREIRTVLSGSVFTSYIVAGIGIAHDRADERLHARA